ncbi:BA75_02827T0 [Komagataella pastoris]|uniref:Cystathionine beta-lyase n=1 Tax=Komagataella pastoris TaxID=4922 RepID=A0A1B2JBS7_PICPA|nr:BA75_02827T0 [Komagataella pastoris]
MEESFDIETELVRLGFDDQYNSCNPPLYQTATFRQDSLSNMGAYDYTRSGNPTRTTLQNYLGRIMGAKATFAVSSGMSALDVIVRLLDPGDEVIAGDDLYGGTHRLLTFLKNKKQLIVNHYDTTDTELMKQKITKNTRMIFLESPTNPLIKVVDVRSITAYAHEINPNCIVVFDNTMMSPVLMSPLADLGVDIQYESATKYLNGHHDIMSGVLATNSEKLAQDLYFVINSTGCGLAPFDCWLLLRGLKTLALRIERQQENAIKIAQFLITVPGLKVRSVALPDHPQYELHKSMAKGPGAVLSFETGSVETSSKIIEACKIWSITVSFGCVNSLISLPCQMSHASIDPDTRAERDLPEDLVRLCVGIENVNDLIKDLAAALRVGGISVPAQ